MSRIAILSPSLSTGDAVTNDVLGMYDTLAEQDNVVRVFAETHNLTSYRVSSSSKLDRFLTAPDDVLIYHHARGWPPGLDILQHLRCRKVIKYHNVTPARFFSGFSSSDQVLCETGREEVSAVVNAGCDLYLADSAFNMNELIDLGAEPAKCFVVPPFHHADRLAKTVADDSILNKFKDGKANLLTVGRVVPNKGHLGLLEAFAAFYFNYNRNARLIIVGKGGEGLSPYAKLLYQAVQALGLGGAVVFTGEATDAELTAYYELADAFVTTSEHEGFCVPLIEAMAMQLPISAYASTAIPETIEDAGILWQERDPFLMAESIFTILNERELQTALGLRGRRRYETHFAPERIAYRFMAAMSNLQ
jgi:glycosyltransferase involved in cell wall biosynthesis